jgi:hypothetical protein
LAYKPEHAVDLDTEAIVAAEIQPADQGDTTTVEATIDAAARGLDAAGCAPAADAPAELIADKGYHSRAVLKGLADGPWQTRIAEPEPKSVLRWRGDLDARRARRDPPPVARRFATPDFVNGLLSGDRYSCFFDLDPWRNFVTTAGSLELQHYFRLPGLPRHKQPWLAAVWRKR